MYLFKIAWRVRLARIVDANNLLAKTKLLQWHKNSNRRSHVMSLNTNFDLSRFSRSPEEKLRQIKSCKIIISSLEERWEFPRLTKSRAVQRKWMLEGEDGELLKNLLQTPSKDSIKTSGAPLWLPAPIQFEAGVVKRITKTFWSTPLPSQLERLPKRSQKIYQSYVSSEAF